MTTPSELADISAAIHDEYFDIERLEHDADRGGVAVADLRRSPEEVVSDRD